MMDLPPFVARLIQMRHTQRKTMAEWDAIDAAEARRKEVVSETRRVMKEAYQKYRRAVTHLTGRELENFTKYQSPRNILSIDPRLKHLAHHLRDQRTWEMLSRAERRLIAQACQLAGIQP